MFTTKLRFLLAAGLIAMPFAPASAQAPKETAEMKLLQQFVGTWTGDVTFFKGPWTPEERHTTVTATYAVALDGNFIEEKAMEAEKLETRKLFTYDVRGGSFRSWWFSSGGGFNESTGTWDATAKTFTWTTKLPGAIVGKTTQHFTDAQTMEWEVVCRGEDGTIYLRASGKNVRK